MSASLFDDAPELDTAPTDAGGAGLLFDVEAFRARPAAPGVRYFERSWLFDDAGTVLAVAEVSKLAKETK